MKTYSPKPTELKHDWYIIDASSLTLGRLSSVVASQLMGKHKPQFSAHLDCGDNVIVINTDNLKVTGNRLEDKKYYRHSGYPGGIKEISLADQMVKDSTKVIHMAVKGMLPKNRLQDDRLARLRIFAGTEHPHMPQQPKPLEFK